jgi:hypothetical protein
MSQTLPGGVPAVDHLRIRAREELGWDQLLAAIDLVMQNRIPVLTEISKYDEIVLGVTSGARIREICSKLKAFKSLISHKFEFCLLAGDTESVAVPPPALAKFRDTKLAVRFRRVDPWTKGVAKTHLPVRFMIGHHEWAVHLRLNLVEDPGDNPQNLQFKRGVLQPELQQLFDEAGVLVGVGIREDMKQFNDMLELFFGSRLVFTDPVDAAVIARLAGVNTPKHSVQHLVWICLGGHLPKGIASVGDNLWDLPTHKIHLLMLRYLRGDTTQLAPAVWVLIVMWVLHIFPDLHAVYKSSTAKSPGDLLRWWVKTMVEQQARKVFSVPAWAPVSSRTEAIQRLGFSDTLTATFVFSPPTGHLSLPGGVGTSTRQGLG